MNVLEDAAKHWKERDAKEHVSHVVRDVGVCHLGPMAIKIFVLVMHASRLTGISLSALKIISNSFQCLWSIQCISNKMSQ